MITEQETQLVRACVYMRFSEEESLAFLEANGCKMARLKYYKIKKQVQSDTLQQLYRIAKIGFSEQHLHRIKNLELVEKLLWENYWVVHLQKPAIAVQILKELREIQPYLSSYYEATKFIIEENYLKDKHESEKQQLGA